MSIRTVKWNTLLFFFHTKTAAFTATSVTSQGKCSFKKKTDLQIRLNDPTDCVWSQLFLTAQTTAWVHEWNPRTFHRSNRVHLRFGRNALKQRMMFTKGRRLATLPPFGMTVRTEYLLRTKATESIEKKKWIMLVMTSSLKYSWANTGSAK